MLTRTTSTTKGSALGDSRFIASVPTPGYPEGMVVHDGKFYVSGPAAFGVGSATVFVCNLDNAALLSTIPISGEPYPGGASCITFDDDDNMYVLAQALGVVRIDHQTHQQTVYSPTVPVMFPFLMNDLVFDRNGNLYITDSFLATIWKVARGGGTAQVWLHDAHLNGLFGPNGIRIDSKRNAMYFTQTTDAAFNGYLYRLPIKDHPVYADLELLHVWAATAAGFAGPDGIELSESGKVYVALAGASQIAVINPNVHNIANNEVRRFNGPAKTSNPAQPLAWANPANIAFDNEHKRILVSLVSLALFAVFDVYVGERGADCEGEEH